MSRAGSWLEARAQAVQALAGLTALTVGLCAYDWRLGVSVAGALVYLESQPIIEALVARLAQRRSPP